MAHKTTHTVPYRRKREGKTDYHKRLSLLRSRKNRLVIRISNQQVTAQIVQYAPTGDKVIIQTTSKDLEQYGWKVQNANIVEAYLVGLALAKKAKVKDAVVDSGLLNVHHGGKFFAAVKGAIDGGLNVPCDEKVFPSQDRLEGKHIASYAQSMEDAQYKVKFARYLKASMDPKKLPDLVAKVKEAI